MSKFDSNKTSILASNMEQESLQAVAFPVLIGDEVAHFHRVDGGYNSLGGFDVVNLVHEVQGVGSPYRVDPEQTSHTVEAHMSNNYYNLDVSSVRVVDEYPDRDYLLSLKVEGYQQGRYSFSEELTSDVDSRETEVNYNDK